MILIEITTVITHKTLKMREQELFFPLGLLSFVLIEKSTHPCVKSSRLNFPR